MDRQRAGLDDETLGFVLQTLRTVTERRLDKTTRLHLDEDDEFPLDLINEMLGPELGLHLLFLPEEVGGLGGGGRDLFRVSEEMARVDLGVATAFLAIALGVDPIIVGGTAEQKQRWLGRIADEGLIVAYGVTEPEAGSNVARLKTEAVPVADADGAVKAYRISGAKQFITNGGVAQIYTVLARAPGGPSFFVVERDTPGFEVGEPEHKHGIRASNTTSLVFDGVEVPADHLLGLEEGRGLEHANAVFGFTRLMVAAFGLGAGEEALARAVAYGRERIQFGEPLLAKQGFTHKLIVPHAVRLEAARAYCEWVADRLDSGEPGLQVEGALAKLFASEVGNAVADAAIQAHGGYGYTHEYEIEKIRRDVRITTIYEGTSEHPPLANGGQDQGRLLPRHGDVAARARDGRGGGDGGRRPRRDRSRVPSAQASAPAVGDVRAGASRRRGRDRRRPGAKGRRQRSIGAGAAGAVRPSPGRHRGSGGRGDRNRAAQSQCPVRRDRDRAVALRRPLRRAAEHGRRRARADEQGRRCTRSMSAGYGRPTANGIAAGSFAVEDQTTARIRACRRPAT